MKRCYIHWNVRKLVILFCSVFLLIIYMLSKTGEFVMKFIALTSIKFRNYWNWNSRLYLNIIWISSALIKVYLIIIVWIFFILKILIWWTNLDKSTWVSSVSVLGSSGPCYSLFVDTQVVVEYILPVKWKLSIERDILL